ncbi:hypothetical protein N9R70_04790, partial [Porticoccaceae bacterium]|nr:hypothetical protein [Porticoccaceae bacterium]
DSDGVIDALDIFPLDASEVLDSDVDGIGDNADIDDDNDGVYDVDDAFPFDASESADTDDDGVGDNADAFPEDATEIIDTDGDGTGDNGDAFPLDSSESLDTDLDGVGNNADDDDDDDGIEDSADICPAFNGNGASSGETEADPDILRFEFCASIIDGIPTLEFLLTLSEDFSELQTASLLFWYVNNEQTWISLNRTQGSEPLRASIPLHQMAASGTYAIRSLRISDNDGLLVALNEGQLNTLGFATITILDNMNSDSEKPYLVSFSTDGWSFDSDETPILSASLEVSDTGSGVANGRVIVEVLSPSGSSIQADAYFSDKGEATINFTLSKYAGSGDYRVNTVRFGDLAGNYQGSQEWLSKNPQKLTLNNPNGDQDGSRIDAFKLSASFDNDSDRPVIEASGIALDDISGVKNVYLRLNRPEGGILDNWLSEGQSEQTYIFNKSIPLTTQFESGKYSVGFLLLTDVADNEVRYSMDDIKDLGDEFSPHINVYFPATTDASAFARSNAGGVSGRTATTSPLIIGSDEADYVFGANSTDDRIEAGGGNDEIYTGDGSDTVDAGSGDDLIIASSGVWDDNYNGGAGVDKIDYSSIRNQLTIDLSLGYAKGEDIGRDELANIENVLAGEGADLIYLDQLHNTVIGNLGDDSFFELPLRGDDLLFGNEGDDTFEWSIADEGSLIIEGGSGSDTYRPLTFADQVQVVLADFSPEKGDLLDLAGFWNNNLDTFNDLSQGTLNINDVLSLVRGNDPMTLLYEASDESQKTLVSISTNVESLALIDWIDSDGDKLSDGNDNCTYYYNPSQSDFDGDLVGNACDNDDDADGIDDSIDAFPLNDLYSIDSDTDGMPDSWEAKYGLDPNDPSDANSDQDNDGVTALDEFLAGTIPSGSIDLDGNEDYDALTDGLLLLRGMFGLDGSALVTGTIASDAAYTESVDIESRIETLGDLADIDGNGDIDALTDGLLTLRYLFGLQGDTLINGVVADDATRTTAEEIEAHLDTLMPAL